MHINFRALMLSTALLTSSSVASAAIIDPPQLITQAKAILTPTQDNQVSGVVMFTKMDNGIKVVADISGLTPGDHGFHIHEFGDCSAPDAASAGGHFNPKRQQHGAPDSLPHHAGDLGNVVADDSGKAHYEWLDKSIALNGPNTILGRSVVVHSSVDDFKTQPTGNSGGRVACGIVGVVMKQ